MTMKIKTDDKVIIETNGITITIYANDFANRIIIRDNNNLMKAYLEDLSPTTRKEYILNILNVH